MVEVVDVRQLQRRISVSSQAACVAAVLATHWAAAFPPSTRTPAVVFGAVLLGVHPKARRCRARCQSLGPGTRPWPGNTLRSQRAQLACANKAVGEMTSDKQMTNETCRWDDQSGPTAVDATSFCVTNESRAQSVGRSSKHPRDRVLRALLPFPKNSVQLMIARPHLRTSSCSAFSSPTVTDTIASLSIASAMTRCMHWVCAALEELFDVQDAAALHFCIALSAVSSLSSSHMSTLRGRLRAGASHPGGGCCGCCGCCGFCHCSTSSFVNLACSVSI